MSNDAQRLPDMSLSVHAIWSTPLFIVVAIFLLVRLVGAAAVAGLLFLVAMIPVQGILAAKQMGLQRAQMKQTESRVKVVNEVLQVRSAGGVRRRASFVCGREVGVRYMHVSVCVVVGVGAWVRVSDGLPLPSLKKDAESRP